MKLNPYVEILARAIYNKQSTVDGVPAEDRELAKEAIEFVNCRTFIARCRLSIMGDGFNIEFLDGTEEEV